MLDIFEDFFKVNCCITTYFQFFSNFRHIDVQPRLQPIHWRLLETPDRIASRHAYNEVSLFLSSSMIRKLETRPIPSWTENATANSEDQEPLFGDVLLASSNNRVKREDISAALSKNITRILEELLKDYDKTERPDFSKG